MDSENTNGGTQEQEVQGRVATLARFVARLIQNPCLLNALASGYRSNDASSSTSIHTKRPGQNSVIA